MRRVKNIYVVPTEIGWHNIEICKLVDISNRPINKVASIFEFTKYEA